MDNNNQRSIFKKPDYGLPPPNYIPGLGRGAVGFITRSDIGPANTNKESPVINVQQPQGYVPGMGRASIHLESGEAPQDMDNGDYNDSCYDNWNGYSQPLFNYADYDDEDKEADEVYCMFDQHMDSRRKRRREEKLKEEIKKLQQERPSIAQQFADLKRSLGKMNYDEWTNIPEANDYSVKKNKKDKYIPVPDTIYESARKEAQIDNSISLTDGSMTPLTNLNDLGKARGTVLTVKLDQQSDSVAGTTTVDKKGYLTDLASIPINSEADIGDFKKARILIKNVININPKNPNGWIAAARIEELDGKLQVARSILAQGLTHCELSEDLWLEAARLETPEKSRGVLAKAVSLMPQSIKIWMTAAEREPDKDQKKKILKRALEHIPNQSKLWKELIELEDDETEAKALLYKAVECVPKNLDMWLALAKLENYEKAKSVLNSARKILDSEPAIWIYAAKLEESQGQDLIKIEQLVSKGLQILRKKGYFVFNRDEWMAEAEMAEKSNNPLTSEAIIRAVAHENIEEDDRLRVWMEEAQHYAEKGSMVTARALYNHALNVLKDTNTIFQKALDIETNYSKTDNKKYLDQLLERAVKEHPQSEVFWITLIKRMWNDNETVRKIIQQALECIKFNENILLLAAKLEKLDNNIDQARQYIEIAKQQCNGARSWTNSIKLELQRGSIEKAWEYAQLGLKQFPQNEKIFILSAKTANKILGIEQARKIFDEGLDMIKLSVNLWIEYVQMEVERYNYARARPLLEKARVKLPKNARLWSVAVKLEMDANNKKGALYMLSRGLKDCPNDGQLWALAIELEPKVTRKKRIVDALKQCPEDPYVNLSVSKLFWKERKLEKARKWMEKALILNPLLGDSWACLYLFEKNQGEKDKALDVIQKCKEKSPNQGIVWCYIKKSERGWTLNIQQILEECAIIIEKDLSSIE